MLSPSRNLVSSGPDNSVCYWWQGEEHLDYLQDRESAGNQEPDGNHQDKWWQQGHLRHCAWCCQGRLPRGITQPQPYASKQLPRLPLRYTDLWLVTWWPLYLLLIGLYLFIQGHNEDGKGKDILPASSSFSQLNAEKESIIRLVYPNVKVTFRTTWLSFWW